MLIGPQCPCRRLLLLRQLHPAHLLHPCPIRHFKRYAEAPSCYCGRWWRKRRLQARAPGVSQGPYVPPYTLPPWLPLVWGHRCIPAQEGGQVKHIMTTSNQDGDDQEEERRGGHIGRHMRGGKQTGREPLLSQLQCRFGRPRWA